MVWLELSLEDHPCADVDKEVKRRPKRSTDLISRRQSGHKKVLKAAKPVRHRAGWLNSNSFKIQDENHLNNSSLPKHLSIDKLDFQLIIRPTPLARHRTAQLPLEIRKGVKTPSHPLKIVFVAALAALYLPLLAGSMTATYRIRRLKEFNIVMSGQFRTIAMFFCGNTLATL